MMLHVQRPNSDQVSTRDHFQIKFKLQGSKTYIKTKVKNLLKKSSTISLSRSYHVSHTFK